MQQQLSLSFIQAPVCWENKRVNFETYSSLLSPLKNKTDLIVLPEMFATGFCVKSRLQAETNEGEKIKVVKKWAENLGAAIAGSFFAVDTDGNYYNRGFFITPEGSEHYYDKRHVFRMGGEDQWITPGKKQAIVSYKNWNIFLSICYDLRFPVWCRNIDNRYDLMLCPANWPAVRKDAWTLLLKARAIENQAYVCGVNRIGTDGNGIVYSGDSLLAGPKGEVISGNTSGNTCVETYRLDKSSLLKFREKFPVWKDTDKFTIEIE